MEADQNCKNACDFIQPGQIAEPYHIPGYAGHIPTRKFRHGASFGRTSRQVLEDPCVSQAPIPVLLPCDYSMATSKPLTRQKFSLISQDTTNCRPQTSGADSKPNSKQANRPKTSCGDFGIDVFQLPFWPGTELNEGSNCNQNLSIPKFDNEVQEMLSHIPPPPNYSAFFSQNVENCNASDCEGTKERVKQNDNGPGKQAEASPGQGKCKGAPSGAAKSKRKNEKQSQQCKAKGKNVKATQQEGCCSLEQQGDECRSQGAKSPNCNSSIKIKNRSPFVNLCQTRPDTSIFRPSEALPPAYSGHIPGYKFRSDGQPFGKITCETKDFMNAFGMFPIRTSDGCS